MAKKLIPRFVSQWNFSHSIHSDIVDDVDEAIPDLTFTVGELRRRFTLETEVLLSQKRNQSQYVYNSLDNFENEEHAFDSPEVTYPRDFDMVDADAAKDALRRAVVALKNARNAPAVDPPPSGSTPNVPVDSSAPGSNGAPSPASNA